MMIEINDVLFFSISTLEEFFFLSLFFEPFPHHHLAYLKSKLSITCLKEQSS